MINVLKRLAELDAMNPNVQAEGAKHASRPGTEKRPGSADHAQKTLDRKKEVKAAAEKRRSEKGVEEAAKPDFLDMDKDGNKTEPMKKAIADKGVKEGFDVKDPSGKVVHTTFSQGEAKKKAEELSKSGNKHSVSYSRTSHPKKDVEEGLGYRGVGGAKHYDDDEGWGSGWKKPAPREVYGVHINGKKWKTFSDKAEADRVAAAVGKKYPDKRVLVMPSTIRESAVSECGMMGNTMPGHNHTPASINMTADSGEELTGMLRDIMKLAGVAGDAVPHDADATVDVLSPTPTLGVATSDGEDMRAMIDKLNPMDDEPKGIEYDDSDDDVDDEEEETDESYDNSPASSEPKQGYNADTHAYHPNPPGAAAGRGNMNNPRGVPTMEEVTAQLFKEYQSFLNEQS